MKPTGAVTIIRDMDRAIAVIQEAGTWLVESGKGPAKWWKPENLNKEFLLRYVKPDEFYVVLVGGVPAAAAALQFSQSSQDWKTIDGDTPKPALYIHWLCVSRAFAGKGMPSVFMKFAQELAAKRGVALLRVDTDADEMKLRTMYEAMGFVLQKIQKESYRNSALYQKNISL